jgi:hypothetical protein
MTYFLCYPHKIHVEIFLNTTRENLGLENMIPQPECKS